MFSPAGQVFSFNTKQLRNQVSTEEGSPNDDDSYLGYSVTTGEFTGDDHMDIAVGMPRGANLSGKVSRAVLMIIRFFFTNLSPGCPLQHEPDKSAQSHG